MELKNYETVKLEELTPGEEVGFKNPREKLEDIKGLADDIEARGLLNPLQVWKTQKDGEEIMVLVGGFRREAAITLLIEQGRANGFGSGVPCHFVTGETLKDARYNALADNIQRDSLSSYEIAVQCAELKLMGDSQKVIAKQLHKSETWVSRKLDALEKAGPALKKAWRTGKLSDDTVETLAKLAVLVKGEKNEDGEVGEDSWDYEAQTEAAEEQLKILAEDTGRTGKTKARKAGKQKAGKNDRLSTKIIKQMVQIVDETDEKAVKRTDYVRGAFDALRATQGSIPLGKMDPEWKAFVKAANAAAEEKAEAEAAEAAEKAKKWAEGKGKKGKKKPE